MSEPQCPRGHGPMRLEPPTSSLPRWQGMWWKCPANGRAALACPVILHPSEGLLALHASLRAEQPQAELDLTTPATDGHDTKENHA